MDLDVTVRTLVERGLSRTRLVGQHVEERLLGMALKAQVAGALVSQHVTVDRSVGNVTGNTPFHRNHFVLEEPRTAVLGVTLEAGLRRELLTRRVALRAIREALEVGVPFGQRPGREQIGVRGRAEADAAQKRPTARQRKIHV